MTPCRRRRSVRRQRQLWISQTKDGLGGRCIAFSSSFRFPLERSFFASSISIGTKEGTKGGKEGGPEGGREETQPADRRQDGQEAVKMLLKPRDGGRSRGERSVELTAQKVQEEK